MTDARERPASAGGEPDPAAPEPGIEVACLTAALVLGQEDVAAGLLCRMRTAAAISREAVREAILQTYLFDGYPTALEGMGLLARQWPGVPAPGESGEFADGRPWRARGEELYARIYGGVGPKLQERARELSPELAEWMVVEGYGKVLARPGLDLEDRELSIVAVLTAKRRPRQLHSHLRGALRIGVPRDRLERLLDRLQAELHAPGVDEARALLARLAG